MSFIKKVLGTFVEIQDEPNPAAPTEVSEAPAEKKPTRAAVKLTQEGVNKFAKHFDEIMESANRPGPDYFEFDKMMETLEAAIPDETTRRNAVFASLKIQGLTKDAILSSGQAYIKVIKSDRDKFEDALEQKLKSEVQAKREAVNEMAASMAEKTKLIQTLTQEIAALQDASAKAKSEVEMEESKLRENSKAYLTICDGVIEKITSDLKKIQVQIKE